MTDVTTITLIKGKLVVDANSDHKKFTFTSADIEAKNSTSPSTPSTPSQMTMVSGNKNRSGSFMRPLLVSKDK